MNTKQVQKQVAVATLQAEGARCVYSEIKTHSVRNGQGSMSQRYFTEQRTRAFYSRLEIQHALDAAKSDRSN